MELDQLRKDCARRQKKGLHFIVTSILIWALILIVHLTGMTIEQKNMATFFCAAVLFPVAWGLSKVLKIDFEGKGNPLTKAGILFSLNQLLYILIAMWVFAAVPEKMLMVYAMIFGAHLMPFSWLYMSKSYLVLSISIPIMALVVGLLCPPYVLALVMVVIEVIFSVCLYYECKPSERRPKSHLPILAITLMAMSASSCVSDWYGKLFIHREPVTFRVYSGDGMPLGNAEVKSEELDAFDNDLIIDGTHYTLTDKYGKATVEAVFYNGPDVSLAGRTTRFTFTAAGYAPFDTIFHYWEGPVDITLNPD